jgi:hypothetical protein
VTRNLHHQLVLTLVSVVFVPKTIINFARLHLPGLKSGRGRSMNRIVFSVTRLLSLCVQNVRRRVEKRSFEEPSLPGLLFRRSAATNTLGNAVRRSWESRLSLPLKMKSDQTRPGS